jgi:hypothetical protein
VSLSSMPPAFAAGSPDGTGDGGRRGRGCRSWSSPRWRRASLATPRPARAAALTDAHADAVRSVASRPRRPARRLAPRRRPPETAARIRLPGDELGPVAEVRAAADDRPAPRARDRRRGDGGQVGSPAPDDRRGTVRRGASRLSAAMAAGDRRGRRGGSRLPRDGVSALESPGSIASARRLRPGRRPPSPGGALRDRPPRWTTSSPRSPGPARRRSRRKPGTDRCCRRRATARERPASVRFRRPSASASATASDGGAPGLADPPLRPERLVARRPLRSDATADGAAACPRPVQPAGRHRGRRTGRPRRRRAAAATARAAGRGAVAGATGGTTRTRQPGGAEARRRQAERTPDRPPAAAARGRERMGGLGVSIR